MGGRWFGFYIVGDRPTAAIDGPGIAAESGR
jgi:hypothetical protein